MRLLRSFGASAFGHGASGATAIAYTPDGRHLLSTGDATLYVWDAWTGALAWELAGGDERPHVLTVSRDGTSALTCSSFAQLFDLEARTTQPYPGAQIWHGRLAPDGSVIGIKRNELHRFDRDGTSTRLAWHPSRVADVAVSLDGTRALTAMQTRKAKRVLLHALDREPGEPIASWPVGAQHVGFTDPGQRWAVGPDQAFVRGPTDELELELGPGEGRRCATMNAAGTLLAIGATDAIEIYAPPNPAPIATFATGAHALAFHPDGRHLAAACGTGIRIFDVVTNRRVAPTALRHAGQVIDVATMPGHPDLIVTLGDDGIVLLVDAECGEAIERITDGASRIVGMADMQLLTATASGVVMWDLARLTSRIIAPLDPNRFIDRVAASADDRWLAYTALARSHRAAEPRELVVVEVATGHVRRLPDSNPHFIVGLMFAADGLLVTGDTGEVRAWHPATGAMVWNRPYDHVVMWAARDAIVLSERRNLRVVEAATGAIRCERTLGDRYDYVCSIGVDRIAMAVAVDTYWRECAIEICELSTGTRLDDRAVCGAPVVCLRASTDGNRLIAVLTRGRFEIFELD